MAEEGSPEVLDKSKILKEIGEKVRTKRESRGLSIQQVQEKTKIRSIYLLAVERGDDSISPGKAYFRAFLKTYASFLGLDGTRLSQEYWALVEQEETPTAEGRRQRRPQDVKGENIQDGKPLPREPEYAKRQVSSRNLSNEKDVSASDGQKDVGEVFQSSRSAGTWRRRRRKSANSLGTILFLLLVAAVALGAWFLKEKLAISQEPTPPANSEGGGAEETLPSEPSLPSAPKPPETKITKTEPNNATTIFETQKGPLTLTISVSSEASCWVSVKADGKYLMEKTLPAGTEQEFKAEKEIVVRAGRPWVLKLSLNGKDLGVAGPFGPVKDLIFRVKG